MTPRVRDGLAFCILSCLAGSNFLWIKFALRELDPYSLVVARIFLSIITLGTLALLLRPRWVTRQGVILGMFLVGISNLGLPQFLLAWATQRVDITVASLLISTVPLHTLIVASWLLHNERVSWSKLQALLVSFSGVALLLSHGWEGTGAPLGGQAALLAAAFCFGSSAVLARRMLYGISPLYQALGANLSSAVFYLFLLPFFGTTPQLPQLPLTWVSLFMIGVLNGGVIYLLFYMLVQNLGPTRTQTVTFVMPLIASTLGVLVLNEPLHWQLFVGGGAILVGMAWFQWVALQGSFTPKPPQAH